MVMGTADEHGFESCELPLSRPDGLAGFPAATDEGLVALLASTRTVAVVGMSPNPTRTSHSVARWLLGNTPFDLYWVNPVAVGDEALGKPFHASLADLPVVPDLVDVFRRREHAPAVVDEAIAVGAKAVWMQLGVRDDDAVRAGREAGLTVVHDLCIKVEYGRLSARIEAERALRH